MQLGSYSNLSSNAPATGPSVNHEEMQNPLGRAALQLGMEVASVYTDAKDPDPLPLHLAPFFDPKMFRDASRWG